MTLTLNNHPSVRNKVFKALQTPIVGVVINLFRQIMHVREKCPKALRNTCMDSVIRNCKILYTYALRQINGKDYKKRAIEVIEEIQSDSYLLYQLNAMQKSDMVSIDAACDEILTMITGDSETASAITSTDKDGSV